MNYRDIKGRKGIGGVWGRRPSKAVVVGVVGVVEAPAGVSFAVAICSPTVTFGGERSRCSEVVAQWRRWRLPVTGYAPLGSGWGILVGSDGSGQPRVESQPVPTSIYSAVWRRSTNHVGLGAPDQGARARPERPLGLTGGRSNLTHSSMQRSSSRIRSPPPVSSVSYVLNDRASS
jgi:hypothetical protein